MFIQLKYYKTLKNKIQKMRKKDINFKQEIQNSQKFLQKLQSIKKTSKQIKDKSKLTQHRNFWVKEFKYLSRLQRDIDIQLTNYFENFDKYFQFQIQDRQIFGRNNYKNYSQLKQNIEQNYLRFQAQTFKQVQSLPLLLQKCSKVKNETLKKSQIREILNDIESVLDKVQRQNEQLERELIKEQQIDKKIQEQNLDEMDQFTNLSNLRSIASDIKGFDFEKEKIKKLKQSQENLLDYLECFNDKLSEDQIYQVINQFNLANRLLEETYQLQQEKVHLDYEESLSLDSSIIEGSDNFNKISHIYSTYIGRGKSVQLYFQRLSIQFPKINRKHLDMITSYIEAKIYKQKKLKAMKRNYYRQKQQLFAKVDKQIHLRIQRKIQKAQKLAETLQRKQEKLKLQKQLEILRTQYNKRKQEKQKQNKAQELALKQAQRKKQAIRKLYLDQLTKKAQQVHQIKSQKDKLKQKSQKQIKQRQQMQKRKQIQQNKPKVQIRQSIERKKIQKRLQQKQIKQKIPEIQAERIKKAIQNYAFRPQVQFSEQRLNQPTQALKKRKQTKMDMADKVQLSKMTGFTVNQLMSDMRFKLNTALQEAGLSNTDYARQLIVSMSKKPNN